MATVSWGQLRTWRETEKWMLSIAVMLESNACMPLEKLIKLINLSFLLPKCIFSTSFSSSEALCVYDIGRGWNPQTFVTFRYSRLLLRDFRARGEAIIPWGLNSGSYAMGCWGLQIMQSQCRAHDPEWQEHPLFLHMFIFFFMYFWDTGPILVGSKCTTGWKEPGETSPWPLPWGSLDSIQEFSPNTECSKGAGEPNM